MQTLESLRSRIESTRDMRSVVGTMKAMAATSIRRFEEAAESANNYLRILELGFQVALRHRTDPVPDFEGDRRAPVVAIVFGSEQGMCGRFNEDIVAFAVDELDSFNRTGREIEVLGSGSKVCALLQQRGWHLSKALQPPSSIPGIDAQVTEVLVEVERRYRRRDDLRLLLFFNRKKGGSTYEPRRQLLLPLDRDWMESLKERDWKGRSLPTFFVARGELYSALIRQYLYISLYRAFAESLAGENASRLAAMQAAESNIEERMEELSSDYNKLRQSAITAELLDIVAGAESIASGRPDRTQSQ